MAAYDIRPLQLKILETLKEIDSVCREHNLRYYIVAGTLLGAVRHKGFIPWDDDLDIAMPRPDYDRLIAHSREWLPGHLEMICAETDANYPFPFAKIQNADTTLIERKHISYLGGVYIDVFPLDAVPESRLRQRLHFMHYEYLKRIAYFVYRDPFKHGHGPGSWIPRLIQRLYSKESVHRKLRRLQTLHDYGHSRYVVDHDDGLKGVMDKSLLGEGCRILFEDMQAQAPAGYREYLANKYGDYMKIPDREHQRQHNFYFMDLEAPYRNFEGDI